MAPRRQSRLAAPQVVFRGSTARSERIEYTNLFQTPTRSSRAKVVI
jgi:hypothetical protein